MRIAFLLPLLSWAVALGADTPAGSNLSEHVEVRLVTIDVLALDGKDRTVPGLGKAAFRLFVDGKETEIDTLDAYCGTEPEPEPRSLRYGGWTTPPDLATGTRRIVLAFDYIHLPTVICPDLDPPGPCMLHTQALQAYQAALADRPDIHDEEIMIVALTGGLRVEQPFTRDRREILETLRRMEYDVTLWGGHFAYVTEEGFFRGLEGLATLLHATDGPKSVVLLTAGDGPENTYDGDFARLATIASDAQVRIYPVDCRGLFANPVFNKTGGPLGLARLASITGGRMSPATNDFTLGYARARRDLGCHYTLGFYDRKPEENRTHTLRVESAVSGVTVRHAATYSFPSREARREMSVEAAYLVPSMFEGGGMRAQVFPLEPHDKRTWDALIAIDFPVRVDALGDAPSRREFGAVLSSGPVVSKTFQRSVTLQRQHAGSQQAAIRRLTFLEPATLSPGNYTLTAVLSEPGGAAPFTAHAEMTVPAIPGRGGFLVGPMIGRRSGPDVVIHGVEDAKGAPADRIGGPQSFRPLIVTETDRAQPLFALTEACIPKKDEKHGPWRIGRSLEVSGGGAAGTLADETIPAGAGGRTAFECGRTLDAVPVERLKLGAYTFAAVLKHARPGAEEKIDSRSASFVVTAPSPSR